MMYLTQTAYMYVHVQYYCSTCNYRLLSSDIIHNVLSGQLQYTVSIDAQKIQTELLHSPLFIFYFLNNTLLMNFLLNKRCAQYLSLP